MTTGSLCGGLATLSVDWNPADRERLIRLERRRICVCACGFTATEFKKNTGGEATLRRRVLCFVCVIIRKVWDFSLLPTVARRRDSR